MQPPGHFTAVDWGVLAAYMLLMLAIGTLLGRRSGGDSNEFFLAGRRMPMLAVALSVLATSLSAATFIGGPEQSFRGDLTYLTASLAALIAAVVVALLFIPRFYALGVTSIYELLTSRMGPAAGRAAAFAFLAGRTFASGARLFMVAIPFAWIVFGGPPEPGQMMIAIAAVAIAATLYTSIGGIRAVIWTDVIQIVLVFVAVTAAAWLLLARIPASLPEIAGALGDADKLRWLDARGDFTKPYSIWAVLTGLVLLNVAAYGTDQDLTQRMLTCRDARAGSRSVIVGVLLGWPVVAMFMLLGLLLYVYYGRPDLMGDAAPAYEIGGSRDVFLQFIFREMPAGLRGLMVAGLFAAAMSSMDSALNAMASSTVADFYRPWRLAREGTTAIGRLRDERAGRVAVVIWGAVLAGFACLCVAWHDRSAMPLLDFALMVMTFAYSGLLAAFLTALLTNRGNSASTVAALITGFMVTLAFRPETWSSMQRLLELDLGNLAFTTLAFPWQMVIATALAMAVCCMGKRQ